VTIAGLAADAAEQMALHQQDRGTVAVLKTTTRIVSAGATKEDGMTAMKARIRAKVGTCRLSDEISRDAKPGVGICKFRPDGKIFAVGGWDKRIRLYSRTSAKLLSVMRGYNEESITSLDWVANRHGEYILAAGSSDGKISVWRPPRYQACT
jgi:WD40 repeat protein